MGALDFAFLDWDIFNKFVLKGLLFSLELTAVATIGGIVFGTFLALMRLSGRPILVYPATIYINTMRSIPLVMVILWFFLLIPMLIGKPIGADLSATITFIAFEERVPITTLSGFMKSSTAIPSLKNSGLLTTSNASSIFWEALFKMVAFTFSAVPTGTVLLSMITL